MKKYSKYLLVLIFIASFSFLAYKSLYVLKKEEVKLSSVEINLLALKASDKILNFYKEGDYYKDLEFPHNFCQNNLPYNSYSGSDFFICNPDFLHCYFDEIIHKSKRKIEIDYKGKLFEVKLHKDFLNQTKFYDHISNQDSFLDQKQGIIVRFSIPEISSEKFDLVLSPYCKEITLEERKYSAGEVKESGHEWDNFNQNILIDKYLVSFRDIKDWLKITRRDSLESKIKITPKMYSHYAYGLSVNEMNDFCHTFGKRLLKAKYFDAATFFPSDKDNKNPESIFKGPYPWDYRKEGSFLFLARSNGSYQVTKSDCEKAYTKDCKALHPLRTYLQENTSYFGLNDVLGGYLEYHEDNFVYEGNVKASSLYFPSDSLWHELGKRGNWDEEDFFAKNFEFKTGRKTFSRNDEESLILLNDEIAKVGFRCYRYE